MKKPLIIITAIFVIFFGFLVAGPLFVINEGEQAVVVRLGQIVNVVTNAGLHVKIPFIDEVHRYSKKIMVWDGEAGRMPTAERQFIFVDVTARWRITNPETFHQAMKSNSEAYSKLSAVINAAVFSVVTENPLIETVRNSNIILEQPSETEMVTDDFEAEIEAMIRAGNEPVTRGRQQLANEMLARSQPMAVSYGVEIIDVLTRQIRYSEELTPSVYARMIMERNQMATYHRSFGEGRKAEWLGRTEHESRALLSSAFHQAEAIRGVADAEATRIFAEAHNRNREFFTFWRAIESYRSTLSEFDRKIISTDMDFFRYMFSATGR
ncbi:MAG: protease modulator HflC [Treponema sp.]|nr:protease modulator HflC [Treponema sp.]